MNCKIMELNAKNSVGKVINANVCNTINALRRRPVQWYLTDRTFDPHKKFPQSVWALRVVQDALGNRAVCSQAA